MQKQQSNSQNFSQRITQLKSSSRFYIATSLLIIALFSAAYFIQSRQGIKSKSTQVINQNPSSMTNKPEETSPATIKPTNQPEITNLKPHIEKQIFYSPTIVWKGDTANNFDVKLSKFKLTALPGWFYTDYGFTFCKSLGGACSYAVAIKNNVNHDYSLTIRQVDTSFNVCDFDNSITNDQLFQLDIPTFTEINTSFGVVRVGKPVTSEHHVVCQQNVSHVSQKESGWVNLTGIGTITLFTPENPNQILINQMHKMLGLIELREYTGN